MPGFGIGDGYAYYRGRVTEAPAHRHAAFQIAVAVAGRVAMLDASGACHRAEVLASIFRGCDVLA